jgi:hypothetical protein
MAKREPERGDRIRVTYPIFPNKPEDMTDDEYQVEMNQQRENILREHGIDIELPIRPVTQSGTVDYTDDESIAYLTDYGGQSSVNRKYDAEIEFEDEDDNWQNETPAPQEPESNEPVRTNRDDLDEQGIKAYTGGKRKPNVGEPAVWRMEPNNPNEVNENGYRIVHRGIYQGPSGDENFPHMFGPDPDPSTSDWLTDEEFENQLWYDGPPEIDNTKGIKGKYKPGDKVNFPDNHIRYDYESLEPEDMNEVNVNGEIVEYNDNLRAYRVATPFFGNDRLVTEDVINYKVDEVPEEDDKGLPNKNVKGAERYGRNQTSDQILDQSSDEETYGPEDFDFGPIEPMYPPLGYPGEDSSNLIYPEDELGYDLKMSIRPDTRIGARVTTLVPTPASGRVSHNFPLGEGHSGIIVVYDDENKAPGNFGSFSNNIHYADKVDRDTHEAGLNPFAEENKAINPTNNQYYTTQDENKQSASDLFGHPSEVESEEAKQRIVDTHHRYLDRAEEKEKRRRENKKGIKSDKPEEPEPRKAQVGDMANFVYPDYDDPADYEGYEDVYKQGVADGYLTDNPNVAKKRSGRITRIERDQNDNLRQVNYISYDGGHRRQFYGIPDDDDEYNDDDWIELEDEKGMKSVPPEGVSKRVWKLYENGEDVVIPEGNADESDTRDVRMQRIYPGQGGSPGRVVVQGNSPSSRMNVSANQIESDNYPISPNAPTYEQEIEGMKIEEIEGEEKGIKSEPTPTERARMRHAASRIWGPVISTITDENEREAAIRGLDDNLEMERKYPKEMEEEKLRAYLSTLSPLPEEYSEEDNKGLKSKQPRNYYHPAEGEVVKFTETTPNSIRANSGKVTFTPTHQLEDHDYYTVQTDDGEYHYVPSSDFLRPPGFKEIKSEGPDKTELDRMHYSANDWYGPNASSYPDPQDRERVRESQRFHNEMLEKYPEAVESVRQQYYEPGVTEHASLKGIKGRSSQEMQGDYHSSIATNRARNLWENLSDEEKANNSLKLHNFSNEIDKQRDIEESQGKGIKSEDPPEEYEGDEIIPAKEGDMVEGLRPVYRRQDEAPPGHNPNQGMRVRGRVAAGPSESRIREGHNRYHVQTDQPTQFGPGRRVYLFDDEIESVEPGEEKSYTISYGECKNFGKGWYLISSKGYVLSHPFQNKNFLLQQIKSQMPKLTKGIKSNHEGLTQGQIHDRAVELSDDETRQFMQSPRGRNIVNDYLEEVEILSSFDNNPDPSEVTAANLSRAMSNYTEPNPNPEYD